MSDKYDDVARVIYFGDDGDGRTTLERITAILRESFPEREVETVAICRGCGAHLTRNEIGTSDTSLFHTVARADQNGYPTPEICGPVEMYSSAPDVAALREALRVTAEKLRNYLPHCGRQDMTNGERDLIDWLESDVAALLRSEPKEKP